MLGLWSAEHAPGWATTETSWHPGGCPDQARCWGLVEIIRCACANPGSLSSGSSWPSPAPYPLWGSVSTSQSALTEWNLRRALRRRKESPAWACLRLHPQPSPFPILTPLQKDSMLAASLSLPARVHVASVIFQLGDWAQRNNQGDPQSPSIRSGFEPVFLST